MEYEKAYVFHPDSDRPQKRRRVEPRGLQSSWPQRRATYQEAWQKQQEAINNRLESINSATVAEVATFLDDAAGHEQTEKVPAAIILSGPGGALQTSLTGQLRGIQKSSAPKRIYVSLPSNSGSNLKALLRTLIQKATQRQAGDDEDELDDAPQTQRKGPRLLNYDLQLLQDYVLEQKVRQVVVAFDDTESFDSDLLSELVEMLGFWRGRIPFATLFSVATSVDFLQQRLSKAAVRCLDGRLFDVAPTGEEVEEVFKAIMTSGSPLWIGAGLASMALERQQDYIQSIDSLVDTLKYAYMSAYYANPLTIFLDAVTSAESVPADHYESIRNLESFKVFARELLEGGETAKVKSYLESDEALHQLAGAEIVEGQQRLANVMSAVTIVRLLQLGVPNTQVSALSKLYVQAMDGKLAGSPLLRTLLLTLKKVASDVALNLLDSLGAQLYDQQLFQDCRDLHTELKSLVEQQKGTSQPLRSEEDVKNSTLRTTVVAQKVELSKQKSALSEQDKAYTALLARFSQALETYFAETLVDPKTLPFHEIFIYDLKSPYRETFTPRPRHAVERALASPHDYLDCECCAPEQSGREEATLAATQPATAVLYQLYLESGSLINASDMWQAFQAVMGEGMKEEQLMALFQRGLAELKYLGMAKQTRKRVDHVAKVTWRGL